MENQANVPEVKSVLGKIMSVRAHDFAKDGEDAKVKFIANVLDVVTRESSVVFLPKKVAAMSMKGDSDAAIEVKDFKGKFISASYHKVGDLLANDTECTSNGTILNYNTVGFPTREDVKDIMSFGM